MKFKKALENRTRSSFGVSVGTGLMLESLFLDKAEDRVDEDRVPPQEVDLTKYKGLIINFYTLVRNILNGMELQLDYDKKHIPLMLAAVLEEFTIIQSLFSSSALADNEHYVKLFIPTYKEAIKRFNINKKHEGLKYIENNIKLENDFNKYFSSVSKKISIYNKSYHFPNEYKIEPYLITTHLPIDLLGSSKFSLLESHTGKLKTQAEFNSKYAKVGQEDLSMLPFNDLLLYLLGDGQIIKGIDTKYKKEIVNIATKCNWTPATTMAKVKNDLRKGSAGISMYVNSFKGY